MGDGVMLCMDCGADLRWVPPILGRCWECHRVHMRKTEPWTRPAPANFEEAARESEEWRNALQEKWREKNRLDT